MKSVARMREEARWAEARSEIREFGQADEDFPEERERMDEQQLAWVMRNAGLSEPRVKAILAQRHADYLKRYADIYDEMEKNKEFDRILGLDPNIKV